MKKQNIRNFSIIAHIDHGKSTLADRLMELTNTVELRGMQNQLLDSMELEREKGITIKLNTVQMKYTRDNQEYYLHLIDTPGHVDFTYEVSRSLQGCEGAILVVDATQGVQAQTVANTFLAMENDLEIIPVLNKVDLPAADVERVKAEIESVLGIDCSDAPLISAKTGLNVEDVLNQIIDKIPAPVGEDTEETKALIFDSKYDPYRGAISIVRVKSGQIKLDDKIKMMHSGKEYNVTELGVFTPFEKKVDKLVAGEVGYVCGSIKSVEDTKVGDTITTIAQEAKEPLVGYRELNPMMYAGFYPIDSGEYVELRDALEKLKLNDASLQFEAESSNALGFGFRIGFLGLLHLEIIQQRIEREFNIQLIVTAPSVVFKVTQTDKSVLFLENPTELPDIQKIAYIEEPMVKAEVLMPAEYVGGVMELLQEKRGRYLDLVYLDETKVTLYYDLPLCEIIFDFFDKLKSITKGYASFSYEFKDYEQSEMQKLDILLNNEQVDAFSTIVHKTKAYYRGRELCKKLKEVIPRHMFEIPIQASVNNRVISRETVKAYRKNVIAKCYGGDISRKKKLLAKQKEGKKKMKNIGSVELSQDVFLAVLKEGE